MMDRQHGVFLFVCDDCPEELRTDTDRFADANAARREAGWSAEKDGDAWVHQCPACRTTPL